MASEMERRLQKLDDSLDLLSAGLMRMDKDKRTHYVELALAIMAPTYKQYEKLVKQTGHTDA